MAITKKGMLDEVTRSLTYYNTSNYLPIEVDLAETGWSEVASHELLTITGLVRLRIIPEVTETGDDTSGDTATVSLGHESDTDNFIADTKVDALANGEIWTDATPTEVANDFTSIIDKIVNNVDVGYEIKGEPPTAGIITFHVWWEKINSTGNVVAGAGGSMAA